MILQRLKRLWQLTEPEEIGEFSKAVNARPTQAEVLTLKKLHQATVIPYKPRDPVAEIVSQLPENQKDL